MPRKTALEYIRVEVAREGKVTLQAMRYYCENRVGYESFLEAVRIGMRRHEALKKAGETH